MKKLNSNDDIFDYEKYSQKQERRVIIANALVLILVIGILMYFLRDFNPISFIVKILEALEVI